MEEDTRARAEEMRLLEGSLREAGDGNDSLSRQISRLKSEIDDARARREEACDRSAIQHSFCFQLINIKVIE